MWGTQAQTKHLWWIYVHVVCLPAHALPLCTSSQVAHRGSLHWMQADTFIVSYPLLQKLESLSLIDEAWLVSGTLPANTHKNRSKDVLPCECACHLRTYTTPTPSSRLQCFGYTHAIRTLPALVWLTAFLTHFPHHHLQPYSLLYLPPLLPQMIPIACA